MNQEVGCPICNRTFSSKFIEEHVNKCIFLSSNNEKSPGPDVKKAKLSLPNKIDQQPNISNLENTQIKQDSFYTSNKNIPLAEEMRPKFLEDYVGQCHILGENKLLRQLIIKKSIPSMILWGPPGCGKTSLANLIATICGKESTLKFVKLSATICGVNDVKEIISVAKNELKFKRKTILFMDEIHRFNKLQQDTFLPHIENGTIILIGATTENPSFSLNSALLSRCRVITFNKLSVEDIMLILTRAIKNKYHGIIKTKKSNSSILNSERITIEEETLQWLAEISDGDGRLALSSLQIALEGKYPIDSFSSQPFVSLDDIKDRIKRSHLLYDRRGEEHYNIISALHKSIRASDDNAALYWLTRMIEGGEDPLYIARRLVRIAGEDIGLADPQALPFAVSCFQGCQSIGMPECDVLLAECAVYLARASKSTEVYVALNKCKKSISEHKGPLPSVPLHLRNAPTKLMSQLGYGQGYNTLHKDKSNLIYMPEGMEKINYFN